MMRRSISIRRRRLPLFVGCLIMVLAVALRPQPGRAQAMVRDEPALHAADPGNTGGPVVSVNGNVSPSDDPTVRQSPSATVAQSAFPATSLQQDLEVIDLTGGRGAAVAMARVKWRPIFYLNAGIAYNDNILIQSHKEGDVVNTLEPGIILALGDFREMLPRQGNFTHVFDPPTDDADPTQRFVYLDYHPSFYLFDEHGSENAVDESATLLGGYNFARLALGIRAVYQKLSIEDIDAGTRVDRDFYTLNLTSLYQYDDKTGLEFNLICNDREYQAPYDSSTEVISQNYLDYAYGSKTQFSAGLTLGYVDYHSITNQLYEQALLRVTSVQFVKLSLTLNGGIEFRQNQDASDTVDGIFDLNASYQVFDGTTVAFVASRETEPSALQDEDVTYTRVGFSVQQRFLSRIYMTLRGTYANADYKTVAAGQTLARSEDFEEVYLGLGADVTQYASVQFSYLFRNSTSTLFDRTFTENIGGIEVRLTY